MSTGPRDQIRHETKYYLYRWTEETDLESHEIIQCYIDAINEWCEEDIVVFNPEVSSKIDQTGGEAEGEEEHQI